MRFSGYFGQERHGVIYRRIMGTGRIPTGVFAAGVTEGVWAKLVELLASEHEYNWLMIEIDATFVKVHPHTVGAAGGNQAMGRTKWD